MDSRRLFLAAAVTLVMLLAYNVAILHTSRTSHRQRAKVAIENVPAETHTLFLGNSLVEAGCDLDAFTAASARAGVPQRAVNLALGGTSPVEHAVILDRILQGPARPKYLIYGFFDDQLNAATPGDWSLLVGNRALAYYYPKAAAEFYAPGSHLKRWELEFSRHVPMLAERSSLWTQVERLRRLIEEIGMPPRATNRFGAVDDFKALSASSLDSFNSRCGAIVTGNVGFSRPIEAIFARARAAGIQVILVEMPLPSRHRTTYYASPVWAQMRRHLQALASNAGATYVVANDWVPDDRNFMDDAHLNSDGAKLFSIQLARLLGGLEAPPLAVAGAH
jgi:hypothetical protein